MNMALKRDELQQDPDREMEQRRTDRTHIGRGKVKRCHAMHRHISTLAQSRGNDGGRIPIGRLRRLPPAATAAAAALTLEKVLDAMHSHLESTQTMQNLRQLPMDDRHLPIQVGRRRGRRHLSARRSRGVHNGAGRRRRRLRVHGATARSRGARSWLQAVSAFTRASRDADSETSEGLKREGCGSQVPLPRGPRIHRGVWESHGARSRCSIILRK